MTDFDWTDYSAQRAEIERRRRTLLKKAPPSSYIVLMYTPNMDADSFSFGRRAIDRDGFIASYRAVDRDRDREEPDDPCSATVWITVVQPGGGIHATHSHTVLGTIRKICEARAVELVEYPETDVRALRALKKRVDKDIRKLENV